jgi:predicted nucleotidyltransferase
MVVEQRIIAEIIRSVELIPLWSKYRAYSAVALSGSLASGLADDQSDVDVDVLLSEPAFSELYEPFWDAIDEGVIKILNPRARLFHEYPIACIPGLEGHYQIESVDVIKDRIKAMDNVTRWIYTNSIAIVDDSGIHSEIRALATKLPKDVLDSVRRRELYLAKDYFYGLKTQLKRNHRESIILVCSQSLSHVLKHCCLCDEESYPYEKWLYQVGVETTIGKRIREYVDAVFLELGRDAVVFEKPSSYVEPGHRNEELEDYRLFHLFKHMFAAIEEFRRENYPDEVK